MVDRYVFTQADRISCEAPVPICEVEQVEDRPGGAANIAANVQTLGGTCSLLGVVGSDLEGQKLTRSLQQRGIKCYLQAFEGLTTIVKMRVLAQHQQLICLNYEKRYMDFPQDVLLLQYQQLIRDVDVVVLVDHNQGTLKQISDFIGLAKRYRKFVVVDTTDQEYTGYQNADLIISHDNALPDNSNNDGLLLSHQIVQALNVQGLLVIARDQAMQFAVYEQGQLVTIQTKAVTQSIYDMTGASDTVVAIMALGHASGYDWNTAMRLANIAVRIAVTRLGSTTVSLAELSQALAETTEMPMARGVVTEPQLIAAVELARQHGDVIVMTNGCFDLLHAGHVAFLEAAKQFGDRLIVAVNTDTSIQRSKGLTRPVVDLAERMEMLARLRSVDWVVAFDDDTPERLLMMLKPTILIKGGDYDISQVVGADIVLSQGGMVKVITTPYTTLHTTQIADKLQHTTAHE